MRLCTFLSHFFSMADERVDFVKSDICEFRFKIQVNVLYIYTKKY